MLTLFVKLYEAIASLGALSVEMWLTIAMSAVAAACFVFYLLEEARIKKGNDWEYSHVISFALLAGCFLCLLDTLMLLGDVCYPKAGIAGSIVAFVILLAMCITAWLMVTSSKVAWRSLKYVLRNKKIRRL